ncbi:MAG TPA: hypothetical protein PK600_09130 [Deltaproteobacteria bacterium]|nr:hypothetical protein [Deltaproteobacteria bacterium]
MFVDEIKAAGEVYRKILSGRRLSQQERDQVAEVKSRYGIGDDGTVTTQDALAELLGVTRRTVVRWKKDGMPVETDGSYDPIAVMAWNTDMFDTESEGDDGRSDKNMWETAYRKFRALQAEVAYNREIGELIPRDQIENLLTDRATELKKSLLGRARRLALKIANKDAADCQALLEQDTLEILTIYSRPSPLIEQKKEEAEHEQD